MRVLHTVPSIAAEKGGPSRIVPRLCLELVRRGVDVRLLTSGVREGLTDEGLALDGRATLVPGDGGNRGSGIYRATCAVLLAKRPRPDLVHDHSLWGMLNHGTATEARRAGIPLVVSPHGTLAPWALRYRRIRKRVAWALYQRRDLAGAALLHATSEQEAADFRRAGLRRPIAVVPNAVDVPPLPERRPPREGPRRVLFLGRLHPVKGLPDLVRAWARLRPAGWEVVLAGESVGGHHAVLEAAIAAVGLSGVFRFVGAVEGEAKAALFASADLLVLPSHTENFGVVVAEALAHGLPVVTTRGTPWRELVEAQAGWWVAPGPAALAEALAEALALPDAEREAMGRRGRALVEARYTWPAQAAAMEAAYTWALGGGGPPPCIRTE